MRLFATFCLVALRNVRRNSRRSLLTILAVSFGLFCLIVFQGLKSGLHREMINGTVTLDAGIIQVHAAGYEPNLASLRPLPDPESVLARIRALPGVRWATRIKTPGLVLAGQESASVLLSGIDPALEQTVTTVGDQLVAGDYLAGRGGLLVGKELADSLGKKVGDRLTLMTRDVFGKPAVRAFTVSGLYRTGLASFNRSAVFLRQEDLRSFLGLEDEWTEIALQADPSRTRELAAALRSAFPADTIQVRTWEEIAPDVRQLISLNDATMTLLIVIVFTIVAMGVTNTMTTVIYERFREIGILTTIGTTPLGIVTIIVLESFFLGVAGSAAGSLAGGAASWHLAVSGVDLTHFTSSNQYFTGSHVLRTHLTVADFFMANAVTLLTSLFAGIYPAAKAARIEPVQAIHHT
ncbi:MAG: lipoprotein-releasing ABC transporter permease subunit [Desulfobulbaceae bacterium]